MRFKYIVTYGILHLICSSTEIYSMFLSPESEYPLSYDILDILAFVARNREQIADQNADRNQTDRKPNGLNQENKLRYMKIKHRLGDISHPTSYEYTVSLLSTNKENTENSKSIINKKVTDIKFKNDENETSSDIHERILSPQLLELNVTWEVPVNHTCANNIISTCRTK